MSVTNATNPSDKDDNDQPPSGQTSIYDFLNEGTTPCSN